MNSLEAQLAFCRQQNAHLVKACQQALRAMQLFDDPDLIPVERVLRTVLKAATTQDEHAQQVMHAYEQAWTVLPAETHPRLVRALELALAGHVTLMPEGAQVRSQTSRSSYAINGQPCNCPDESAPLVNGVKACKHQLAVWLELKAQAVTA